MGCSQAPHSIVPIEASLTSRKHAAFRSAVHLFLIQDGLVLFSRRWNTGYEDGNSSVPAGHRDGEEEVKAAAIRETGEEIGVAIAPDDLDVVGVMHRKSNEERIDVFLTARRWTGQIVNRQPEKCDDLARYSLDYLPANTVPYVARALRNVRDGRWFDSFGWNQEQSAIRL